LKSRNLEVLFEMTFRVLHKWGFRDPLFTYGKSSCRWIKNTKVLACSWTNLVLTSCVKQLHLFLWFFPINFQCLTNIFY
jgi:hypothetical protein